MAASQQTFVRLYLYAVKAKKAPIKGAFLV